MAGIEHRRPGTSSERWRVTWRELGDKQDETFTDAAAAQVFKQQVEAAGNRWPYGWVKGHGYGPPPTSTGPTFRDWAEKAVSKRIRADDRTKADYRRDLAKYAYPHFGDLPVDAITQDDHADPWIVTMTGSGLAAKTITNVHGLVSSIMTDALRHRPPLIDYNPFAGRLEDLPDVRTEEMVFLTPAEFDAIVRWMADPYSSLARLLAGTGLRYGEATALRVREVDLLGKRRTLTVIRAWKRLPDSTYVIGEPKTPRARRTLSLSDELVDLLLPLVAGKRGDELVVQSVNGLQLLNSTFHDVGWAPAVARARVCERHFLEQRAKNGKLPRLPKSCECAGVLDKEPRVHDLRHSHVSWLIADGLPLPTVSRRLGHKSYNTTVDRYHHLVPDLDDAVNASVDRALAPR